ncbi:hypothetical protein PG996_007483 [Apiospora saccharicola]|uniref:F-box domain-containing protein n=1 Tax=Apiospora saccharicola TaxID=335842 RepID=A0ABR1VAY7_9PEZI
MADLGALEVLPVELQLMVLDMANVQSVCRFSQVNRRAHALVGDLSVSLAKVRAHLPSRIPRFLDGCRPTLILPLTLVGLALRSVLPRAMSGRTASWPLPCATARVSPGSAPVPLTAHVVVNVSTGASRPYPSRSLTPKWRNAFTR